MKKTINYFFLVFFVLMSILFMVLYIKSYSKSLLSPKVPHCKGYYLVRLAGQNDDEFAGFIVEGTNRTRPYSDVLKSGVYCHDKNEILENLEKLPPNSEVFIVSSKHFLNAQNFLTSFTKEQILSIYQDIKRRNITHIELSELF